ncbi:MAG: prepilin-type N-terminal cleavage/methylation domain-containing protein [Pseudomonadota bacterium]
MKTPASRQAGFTLLEAVIALGLLAFTLLGMFQMQLYAARSTTASRETTSALALLQQQLETVMAAPFSGPLLNDGNTGNTGNLDSRTVVDNSIGANDNRGNPYTLITNIQDIPDDPSDPGSAVNSKLVRVIVVWGPGGISSCGITTCIRNA